MPSGMSPKSKLARPSMLKEPSRVPASFSRMMPKSLLPAVIATWPTTKIASSPGARTTALPTSLGSEGAVEGPRVVQSDDAEVAVAGGDRDLADDEDRVLARCPHDGVADVLEVAAVVEGDGPPSRGPER